MDVGGSSFGSEPAILITIVLSRHAAIESRAFLCRGVIEEGSGMFGNSTHSFCAARAARGAISTLDEGMNHD